MRYLALVIIVVLSILYGAGVMNSKSLISVAESSCFSFDIVDLSLDNQVIKIDKKEYGNLMSRLHIEEINVFYIEDRLIVEGYSNMLNNFILIDNMRINIQVSISEDVCLVGYPLIKNSF